MFCLITVNTNMAFKPMSHLLVALSQALETGPSVQTLTDASFQAFTYISKRLRRQILSPELNTKYSEAPIPYPSNDFQRGFMKQCLLFCSL